MPTNKPMSVESKWDEVFRSTPWAKYPPEELIRFTVRTFGQVPDRRKIRFLDLGCGIGTSSWYLSREGFTTEGIDTSEAAIEFARQWFSREKLEGSFQIASMQELPFEKHRFDCVIDIVSSGSIPFPLAQQALTEVRRVLKPGGIYFGTFLGDESTIEGTTNPNSIDPKFYESISAGPIKRGATTRLMNEEDIRHLFQDFNQLTIDYALRTANNREEQAQNWIVTAKNPA